MALYSGKCDGGPCDGRPLHHALPVFLMAMRGIKPVTWVGPPTSEIEIIPYRYVDGKWVWARGAALSLSD